MELGVDAVFTVLPKFKFDGKSLGVCPKACIVGNAMMDQAIVKGKMALQREPRTNCNMFLPMPRLCRSKAT
jgi:hypothetical protein